MNNESECFTIWRVSLMIVTSQLVHPGLSLPIDRIDLLRVCTAFLHSVTLADLQCTILSLLDVKSFCAFLNAINGPPFYITDENITDLSSLAAEFRFIQLLCQVEARLLRFPVIRSAT
jgi:hypothetical protein